MTMKTEKSNVSLKSVEVDSPGQSLKKATSHYKPYSTTFSYTSNTRNHADSTVGKY